MTEQEIKIRTISAVFHHPQQPQSTHPSRTITIPPMTTVPTYAHRCNLSNHIDTRELVGIFRDDATRQPDGPTPYSEIRKTFRSFDTRKSVGVYLG